jgi:hypothetical protein
VIGRCTDANASRPPAPVPVRLVDTGAASFAIAPPS